MTDYALALTALHADYAAKIIELAENSVASGEPINRPIWWLDPTDQEALVIDSGKKDTLLVPYVSVVVWKSCVFCACDCRRGQM